jgi:hypothetical protein
MFTPVQEALVWHKGLEAYDLDASVLTHGPDLSGCRHLIRFTERLEFDVALPLTSNSDEVLIADFDAFVTVRLGSV